MSAVSDSKPKLNPQVPPFGPLPVAVIGCGRMGRLHCRFYSQMPQVKLVGLYDANPDVSAAAAAEYKSTAFDDLSELLSQVAAATIAVPTTVHPEIAKLCMDRGVACLIEKPLAKDVADGRNIVEWARASNVTVQVGHIERFNPAVRAMNAMNIKPGFIEVTRISPLTFRSIDVGVVLDMMIHDIDIVLQLAQSKVDRIDATGVSITGEAEDICNARLVFASGCVANITASRLALKTERKLRVFSSDAYVSVDYQKRYGIVAHRSGNVDAIRDAVARIRSGEIQDLSDLNFADLVTIQELQIDDADPLRAELESFVNAVKNRSHPEVPAEDGLAAVEVATRIVNSISTKKLS
jgi:predicted dehydrogenase